MTRRAFDPIDTRANRVLQTRSYTPLEAFPFEHLESHSSRIHRRVGTRKVPVNVPIRESKPQDAMTDEPNNPPEETSDTSTSDPDETRRGATDAPAAGSDDKAADSSQADAGTLPPPPDS